MNRFADARAFLSRGRTLALQIRSLQETRDMLHGIITSAGTAALDGMPHAPGAGNPVETRVLRVAALDERINVMIDRMIQTRCEILDVVERVPSSNAKTALLLFYVEGLPSWAAVADRMHYSYQHVVQRLHPEGLDYVQQILQQDKK